MAGRARSFTDDEIKVIRAVALRLKSERSWSGRALGEALGIAQQNASRFVAAGSTAGMDRVTANRLAQITGFRDVEHMLLEAGVLAEMTPAPEGADLWSNRDSAVRLAKLLGYPYSAVEAVLHRHTTQEHAGKRIRWWIDKFVLETLSQGADLPAAKPGRGDMAQSAAPAPALKEAQEAPAKPQTEGRGLKRQRRKRTGTNG